MKSETRTELMAIPIVAIVLIVGIILLAASVAGAWAWILIGIGGIGLIVILAVHYSRSSPHPALSSAPPDPLSEAAPARHAQPPSEVTLSTGF